MSTSQAQTAANQSNSQHSTGPRTEEGKKRSSLNALRHGLTSQIIVLPTEDMDSYRSFTSGFVADFQPVGALETQFVQTLADTQWRLNRLRAHEANLFALGHEENAPKIDTDDEAIQTALAGAMTLRDNTATLKTLSIYEQRLNRTFMTTLKELRETQALRKARDEAEMQDAILIRNQLKMEGQPFQPAEYGFVLTNAQIDRHLHREATLTRARNQQKRGTNAA